MIIPIFCVVFLFFFFFIFFFIIIIHSFIHSLSIHSHSFICLCDVFSHSIFFLFYILCFAVCISQDWKWYPQSNRDFIQPTLIPHTSCTWEQKHLFHFTILKLMQSHPNTWHQHQNYNYISRKIKLKTWIVMKKIEAAKRKTERNGKQKCSCTLHTSHTSHSTSFHQNQTNYKSHVIFIFIFFHLWNELNPWSFFFIVFSSSRHSFRYTILDFSIHVQSRWQYPFIHQSKCLRVFYFIAEGHFR